MKNKMTLADALEMAKHKRLEYESIILEGLEREEVGESGAPTPDEQAKLKEIVGELKEIESQYLEEFRYEVTINLFQQILEVKSDFYKMLLSHYQSIGEDPAPVLLKNFYESTKRNMLLQMDNLSFDIFPFLKRHGISYEDFITEVYTSEYYREINEKFFNLNYSFEKKKTIKKLSPAERTDLAKRHSKKFQEYSDYTYHKTENIILVNDAHSNKLYKELYEIELEDPEFLLDVIFDSIVKTLTKFETVLTKEFLTQHEKQDIESEKVITKLMNEVVTSLDEFLTIVFRIFEPFCNRHNLDADFLLTEFFGQIDTINMNAESVGEFPDDNKIDFESLKRKFEEFEEDEDFDEDDQFDFFEDDEFDEQDFDDFDDFDDDEPKRKKR